MIAGIDEAGCAPLAGPVVAAAVILPPMERRPKALRGLTDSKLLSRDDRERYFHVILRLARVGVGAASVAEIDRLNILRADMLAMTRALAALGTPVDVALVDGNRTPALPCRVHTLVGGDRRSLSIAAASVVAKVTRDRLMRRLGRRHPGYGWESNMGYPTEDHYLGLLRLGPTLHHRRTFAPLTTLFGDEQLRLDLAPIGVGGFRLVALREDLHSVCIEERRPIGVLRRVRTGWVFRALGFDGDGNPVPGGGPLGASHERLVPAPDLAALRTLLAGSGLPAAG